MKNYFMELVRRERVRNQVWVRFFDYDEVMEIYTALIDNGATTPLVKELKNVLGFFEESEG